ncbi:anion permease [Escherichia coli]|nr:anion permease [Escherichia coli]
MIVLVLVFYFAHYLFASLFAHTATMLPVILAVGKGRLRRTNGTTVYPAGAVYRSWSSDAVMQTVLGIIYGCGYVKSKDYWRLAQSSG